MNRKAFIAVVAIAAIVAAPMLAAGNSCGKHGKHGHGAQASKCEKHWDAATVEDFSGEVLEIVEQDCKGCGVKGVHVKVKGEKETISIVLGPAWYVNNQDTKLEVKDKIAVHGSRTKVHGEVAIVAQKITRGDDTFILRDENGRPSWAGWRHGKTS